MTNLVTKVVHFGKPSSYGAIEIADRYSLSEEAFSA